MSDRPILFSRPMVNAILEDRKTQTRRIVKPQPEWIDEVRAARLDGPFVWPIGALGQQCGAPITKLPYGNPGDRLWVRESGWERPERTQKMMRDGADTWPRFAYAADNWSDDDRADFKRWGFKTRPSIHMPRWASRILLEITGIRVERLNDISEDDVEKEGAIVRRRDHFQGYNLISAFNERAYKDARLLFEQGWESINGPGSWAANPWVWVVSFKRVEP